MDLHRLRVVGFDTSVSKKEGEKKFIAELEKCEEHCKTSSDEQKNETSNDNKQSLDDKIGPPGPSKKCHTDKISTLETVEEYLGDTSSLQETSVKLCLNDEITPTETSQICLDNKTSPPGTSKKLRFTKSKSNSEIFKILPKKKPRTRDLKITTSSDVDIKKQVQKSTHQKKRPFNLLNRNSRIQQKVENVKEKKEKDKEVHYLFARETPSYRNRAVNERVRAKKKRDSKLPNDIYGFQRNNRCIDPYLYQMSCLNFIDTDKFLSKKFRVGFHRKVKPRPPQPVANKFCKYHAMRVLNYACENGDSPSIYYNLDTHPHQESDYDQEDGFKKVRLRYMAKDESVEVSPSSFSPVSINFRDAATGPSKVELNASDHHSPPNLLKCEERMSYDIQKPSPQPDTPNPCAACGAPAHNTPKPCASCATPAQNIPNPCAACATAAQNVPNPCAACATPAQNIPNPCASSTVTTPVQTKPHEAALSSCLKKHKKTKKIFFVVNNVRKSFFSRFFQHVTDFHTNKKHSGKNCVKYVLFGLLIVVWSPCLLAVILAWVVMCPGRITNIIKTDTSKRSFPTMNHSFMNRFRKKESLSEYQRKCFENYMPKKKRSFMTSVASWYSRTFGNSFNAVISLFKLKKKSQTCCAGSSSLPTTHPNPRKRYTLFYADNRGWVMKPSRRRTTRSCASTRVVQNMRCDIKSKFWPVKSKSEKKPQKKTIKRIVCPVHGVNNYPRHQLLSPAGDAYPYENPWPGCICWDKYPQGSTVYNVVKSRHRPRQQVNIPSTFFYSTSGNASDLANETLKTKTININSNKIADNITSAKEHIYQQKNGTLPYGVAYNYPCKPTNPLLTNFQIYNCLNCKHKFDLAGKTLTFSSKCAPGLLLKGLQRQFPKRWIKHQVGNAVNKSFDVHKYPGFTDITKSVPPKSTPNCKPSGLRGQNTKHKIAVNCLNGRNHKSAITNDKLNTFAKNLCHRNKYGLADISTSNLTKQGNARTHKMNKAHSKHIAHLKVTNKPNKTKKGKFDITASKYTFEAKQHLHKQTCKHKLNKTPVATQYKPRTVNIMTNTNPDKTSNYHSEKKHKQSKQIYRYKPYATHMRSSTVDNTTHTHRDIALDCDCDEKYKKSKQWYKYKPDQIPVAIQKQPSTVEIMTNTNHDIALNCPSEEKQVEFKLSYKYEPYKTPNETQKQSSTVDNTTRTHRDIALNCPCEEKYKHFNQGYKYKPDQSPVATQKQPSTVEIMTNTNHDIALNCPSEEKHEQSKLSYKYKPDKTFSATQKHTSAADNTTRTYRDIALNCPCEEKYKNFNQGYKYKPDQIPVATQNQPTKVNIMTSTSKDIALNYPPEEKYEQSKQKYKYKPDQIAVATQKKLSTTDIMTNTNRGITLFYRPRDKQKQSKQEYEYEPDQIPVATQNQRSKVDTMTSTSKDIALNCPCGEKQKQSKQECKNKPDQIPVATQHQPGTADILIGTSRDKFLHCPSGETLDQSKQGLKYNSEQTSVATQKQSNLADDTTNMGHDSAFNYHGGKDLLSIPNTANEDTICIKKTNLPESLPEKQDFYIQKQSSKIEASVSCNCGCEYKGNIAREEMLLCRQQTAYSLRQKAPLVGKAFEMRFSVAQPLTTRKFQTEEIIVHTPNPPNSPLFRTASDSHCDVTSLQNKPNNETKQTATDSTNTHSHKITSTKQPHTQRPNLTQAQFDTLREQLKSFGISSVCTCETNKPIVTEKTLENKVSGSKFSNTKESPQSSKRNSEKIDNTQTIFTLSSERLPTKIKPVNSSLFRIAPDCRCHATFEAKNPKNQTVQIATDSKNKRSHKITMPKEPNLIQTQSQALRNQLKSLTKAKNKLIAAQKSLNNKVTGAKFDGTQRSPHPSKRNSVKTNKNRSDLPQPPEQKEYDIPDNEANQIATDTHSHKTSLRKQPPGQQPNLTQERPHSVRGQSQSFRIAPDCTCGKSRQIVAQKGLSNKVTGSKLYGTQRSPHPSKRNSAKANKTRSILPQPPKQNEYDKADNGVNQSHKTSKRNKPLRQQPNLTQARPQTLQRRPQSFGKASDCTCRRKKPIVAEKRFSNKVADPKLYGTQRSPHPSKRKSQKTNNTRPILPQSPEQNKNDKPDNEANQIVINSKNAHSHKTIVLKKPPSQQPNLTQSRPRTLQKQSQPIGITPSKIPQAYCPLLRKSPDCRCGLTPKQNKPDNQAAQIARDGKNTHIQSRKTSKPPSQRANLTEAQSLRNQLKSLNRAKQQSVLPEISLGNKVTGSKPYKAEKVHLATSGQNITPHSYQSQRLQYPFTSQATRKTALETYGQRKFSQPLLSVQPDNPKVDSLYRRSQSARPVEKQFDTIYQQPKAKQTIRITPGSCKCTGVHQLKTEQASNNKVEPNTGLQKFSSVGVQPSDKTLSNIPKSPEHEFKPSLVKILQKYVDKGTSQESPKSLFWYKYKALLKLFRRAKTQQPQSVCYSLKIKEPNIPVPQNNIRQSSIQSCTGTDYSRFVHKSSSQLRSSSRVSQYSSKVSSLIRSLSSKLFNRKISQQTKIPKNPPKKPRSVVFSSSREYFSESNKGNKSRTGVSRHGQPLKSSLRSTLSSRISLTSCNGPVDETKKTSLHTPKPMLDEESNPSLPIHSSYSMFNDNCSCQIHKRSSKQCEENSRYIGESLPVHNSYSCLSSISKTPSLPSHSSKLGCRCNADDNTSSAYHMHPTFSSSILNQKSRTSQDSSIVMSEVPVEFKCSCDKTFLTQNDEISHQILKKPFKRKSPTILQHLLCQPNRRPQFLASLNRSQEILSAYNVLTNNQRPSKKHDSHVLAEKQTVLTQCLSPKIYQPTPTANQTMPSQYLGEPIIPITPGMCTCAAKHFGKTTIKNDLQSNIKSPLEKKQEKPSTLHVLTALVIPSKTGYLAEKLHQPSKKIRQHSRKSITDKIPPSILPPYLLSSQPIQLYKDSRKTRVGTEVPAEHGNEQKVSKSSHKNAENQFPERSYYPSEEFQKLHFILRARSAKKKRLARANISKNAHTKGRDKTIFGTKHVIVQRLQTPKSPRIQIYQEIQPNPQIQPNQQNLQMVTKGKPPPELLQRHSPGQGLKGRPGGGVQQPYPDFDRVSMRYPGLNSPRRQSRQMPAINRPDRIHPLTVSHYKPAPGATPPQNYTGDPCYANPANRCAKQSPYDECALRRAYDRRPYVLRQQEPKADLIKKLTETKKRKTIKQKHEKETVPSQTRPCSLRESILEMEKDAWPNDVTCRPLYINTLKSKPAYWIYERWPGLYPAFLNFHKFMRTLGQMLIYLFAICFWSPCLVCGYLCVDLFCC